jgi:dynein heavy chain 1
MWNELLVDLRKSRRTFDTTDTSKFFGPVEIDFTQVQARVNMKYDALHREMLAKFGSKMSAEMNQFFGSVQRSRQALEGMSIDGVTTAEAVLFVTTLQDTRRKIKQWTEDLASFQQGQQILERQRYAFPDDWLYIDNIEGEWDALNDIVSKKNASVQGQMGPLQKKVVDEDRQINNRITSLLQDWEKNKPVGGSVRPDAAVNTLTIYESRFAKLQDEFASLTKAKDALGIALHSEDRLTPKQEELLDLKSSWDQLSKIWTSINDLKQTPWSAVVPRKIRTALEHLINQLKNLPARVRSYPSYEVTMENVKGYLKGNKHITNLKSDSLKERHWKQLIRELGVDWVFADMTLGDVWDVDMTKNDKKLGEIMLQAQGEMGLEEYLRKIREEWSVTEFELVNYHNKTHLIRGWDDIFNLLKEHINSLEAMRLSPYFKAFEEESLSWHDKLSRLFSMLDGWMDVQRKWVYLEGIFSGSADIKQLLPNETARFGSISSEFLGLMKKVYNSPMALDVLAIPDGEKTLERLKDLLEKIQKSLTDYLDRQREAFPRFYFVGDEDLLEIIGNSKNVDRLQKHFKKMFAGVATITLNDDHSEVSMRV